MEDTLGIFHNVCFCSCLARAETRSLLAFTMKLSGITVNNMMGKNTCGTELKLETCALVTILKIDHFPLCTLYQHQRLIKKKKLSNNEKILSIRH